MSDFDARMNVMFDSLRRAPGVLEALCGGLPPQLLHARDNDSTWSAKEVLDHLAHAERTNWVPRVDAIRSGKREFPAFDRFAHLAAPAATPDESLVVFRALRNQNLATLQQFGLKADDLEQVGIHPEFGEVTLGQLLATWVAHDLGHITQIARTMARHFRDDVGPWRAYLSAMRYQADRRWSPFRRTPVTYAAGVTPTMRLKWRFR